MPNELTGRRIAFLTATEGVEQAELTSPWQAVLDAGGTPELLAPGTGKVQAFNHLDRADTFEVTGTIADADPAQYAGLVLPGGVANADFLRTVPEAVRFAAAMFAAGLVRGRTLTSWPSLQTDLRNAGGTWVDTEVQVCTAGPNVLVTSRKPADLPAFCEALVTQFSQAAPPA